MFWASLCPRGDAALLRIPFLVSQTRRSFAISGHILTFIYLHTHMRNCLLHYFIYQPSCKEAVRAFSRESYEQVTVTVL